MDEKNLSRWSIPYELPVTINHDPVAEPVVIRRSFSDLRNSVSVIPYGNGFVTALIRAHDQGLHLRLRPEDIWLSILSQLRVYAYRHPGSIPGLSSSHDLNIDLSIDLGTDPGVVDLARLDEMVAGLTNTFIDDATLRDWVTPIFTTTTATDKSIASVVMMGQFRKSTEQSEDLRSRRGLSSISLLGEKSDWQETLRRVEQRVPTFGQQTIEWYRILVPVIKGMILSFESPELPQSKDFWHQSCHFDGTDIGNDKETLTGWITAFCFWSDSGFCLHPEFIDESTLHHPRRRNSIDEFSHGDEPQVFWDDDKDDWYWTKVTERKKIFIEDVTCHHIFPKNIPNCIATALLYVRDYSINRMVHSVTIVAGSIGAMPTKVG